MSQQHRAARRRIVLPVLLGCAGLFLAVPAATPAPQAAKKKVTITLSGSGKASWSLNSGDDKGALSIRYSWSGTLRFSVPTAILKDPAKGSFRTIGGTTLRGNWTSDLSGQRFQGPNLGPYRCHYAGRNVPGRVTATLSRGPRGTLRLVLTTRIGQDGFFPTRGSGATISCNTPIGETGPPHFSPAALFRDNFLDHGRMTKDTAYITAPSRLLPRGVVKLAFPRESGQVKSQFRGTYIWKNRGTVSAKAR
jgi:hypothetical protein